MCLNTSYLSTHTHTHTQSGEFNIYKYRHDDDGQVPLVLPDVDDDSDRPHVQRAVVAFVPQDFRSEVRRRADHRAPKRLLTDDPSESEVAKLHLQEEDRGLLQKHLI